MKENKKVKNLKGEIWRRYKDTDYYLSNMGRAKRIGKTKEILLKEYKKSHVKKGSGYMVIKINGKQIKLAKAIWITFNGEIPYGYNIVHRNKVITDNSLVNLRLVTKKQLGELYGSRNGRQRLIYDMDKKVFYKGTREAAEKLSISRQTVSNYCNGKVRNPLVNIRWAKRNE